MMAVMFGYLLAPFALLTSVGSAADDTEEPIVEPPASVVVAFDSEKITPVIVEGLANKESDRRLEANDPVRIASISKLVMALAALRLVDEGKIDLQADVSEYLGWRLRSPFHPDVPITLANLMMHRAGLSDAAGYIVPLGESLEARLADPAAWRETGPPGEAAFEYANLGSPVVATALEAASGERYDRLIERLVFAPLGVTACLNWTLCDPATKWLAVTLYRHTGEIARDDLADFDCPIPVAEGVACTLQNYVPGTNASVFSPQGGVRIGMVDLAKIGQAMRNRDDRILSPAAISAINASLLASENEGQEFFCYYGLHLQIIDASGNKCEDALIGDGLMRIGHSGEAYGLQSGLWIGEGSDPGFAYFLTEAPPPAGGEDTGGFTQREKALLARARAMLQP